MAFPRRTLLGGLVVIALLRQASPCQAGSPPPAPEWSQVEATSGELAFVRSLTAFALEAPSSAFPNALAAAGALPEGRALRAETVLAHAFVSRDTEAAIRWFADHAAASPALLEGFFTSLADRDPARAWTEGEALADADARQTALGHVASTRALSAPLDALARAERLPPALRDKVLPRALDAWIRKSPDAAFSWITQSLPEKRRRAALVTVLPSLGARDFPALLRLEAAASDPVLREAATESIERTLPLQSLDIVWRRFLSPRGRAPAPAGEDSGPRIPLHDLLDYAATRPSAEIAAALPRIASAFDSPLQGLEPLLSVWVPHAPDAALAWAKTRPDPALRDAALLAAQPGLLETRPDLALAQVDAAPAGPFRTELVSTTAATLAYIAPSRALDWALALPSAEDRTEAIDGLREVAIYDPDFLALATPRLADNTHPYIAGGLAELWMQSDPAAASEWFATLPPGPLRDRVQESLFAHASRHAPELAIARAHELPAGPERSLLIEKLIDHQAAAYPTEIFELIETLPDGSGRRQAREAAFNKLGYDDPQTAAALIDSGALGDATPSSINALASAWSARSPAAAADWLAGHISPAHGLDEALIDAVNSVAIHHGLNHPDRALAWARGLRDPKAARAATLRTAEVMAPRFPERAWREVVSAYPDEPALRPVIDAIALRAPDHARRLLDASDLPAELRAKLLASFSNP